MRKNHRSPPLALLLVACLASGCSGPGYIPARIPHVATLGPWFAHSYAKDGKVYEGNVFGDAVIEAVDGNPRAEEEASAARSLTVAGFVVEAVGVAGIGTGIGMNLVHDQDTRTAGTFIALGGAVALLTGAFLAAGGSARAADAVNVYNDDVSPKPWKPVPCDVVLDEGKQGRCTNIASTTETRKRP